MARLIQKMKVQLRRFSAVRTNTASLVSKVGPFDMDGQDWTFVVTVDGGAGQSIDILQSAVSDPSAATVEEMVSIITSGLTDGETYKDANGSLVVGTETSGDGGSVEISGDAVGGLFGFKVTSAIGGGFNDLLGTVNPVDDGSQEGTTRLREMAPVTLVCQVDRTNWGQRQIAPGGERETRKTIITVERRQLKARGMINDNGHPIIHVGDRIGKLMTRSGKLIVSFDDPNGMWIHGVEPAGHGLKAFGDRTNRLYILICSEDRVTS